VAEAKNRTKQARDQAGETRAQARELIRAACEPGEKALAGAKAELEREFIRLCRLEGEYGNVREC
jgi:F0F1-type ATP synthase membrane subunit b/b'